MKKLLLSLCAACAVTVASAAPTQIWSKSVNDAFADFNADYNAAVAVDSKGAVVATGAFSQDITVAGAQLTPVGTSAYITKYDNTGNSTWAVAIVGSASISKVVTDADDNIYVAGQYADEITFGTTSGDEIVEQGMTVDGDPCSEPNSAFIAKYNADGKVLAVRTFVPQLQSALVSPAEGDETFYLYFDGAVYFRIDDLKVINGNVYVAAVYLGVTAVGDVIFDASYVNYLGFMYSDNMCASIFSLDSSLENAKVLDQLTSTVNNGDIADNTYEVWSAGVDVDGDNMVVAYAGVGNLSYNGDVISSETDDAFNTLPFFVFANFKNGEFVSKKVISSDAAMINAYNSIDGVSIIGENAYINGNKYTKSTADEAETYTNDLFVASLPALSAENAALTTVTGMTDKFYFLSHGAACTSNGTIYIPTLAYYNNAEDGHKKAELAGDGITYAFSAATIAPTDYNANSVAVTGEYIAFSHVGETGATFSLYSDPDAAGIDDIVIDENAPVEYFNLQGVRVANPENGLYIVRKGNNVTKQLIRR